MTRKFKRRDWHKYRRLGKGCKKKQKWRKPRGRHNKIREHRRGYPAGPSVGMRKSSIKKINKQEVIKIRNEKDLMKVGKGSVVLFDKRIGRKKRTVLAEKAEKIKVKILNLKAKSRTKDKK